MLEYNFDLTAIWAGIIALAIFAYVVMDGFDLGVGILFKFFPAGEGRNRAMNSIAPVWDGNETWLVLGGGGLFAAFPLAYAVILPALYAPIIAMLLGLVFRGVAFEYRWRDPRHRALWDAAFTGGSIIAAFAQGVALGALLQGIEVDGRAYAGGWWNWLTPFSLLTGAAVLTGYALLGATWLVMKTEGDVHDIARRYAYVLAGATLAAIGIVSLWMAYLQPEFYTRWFSSTAQFASVAWVPLLLLVFAFSLFQSLIAGRHHRPFFSVLGLFLLCFVGLGINFYPNIIPPDVTIWQAAAPESSLIFLLVGAAVLIPAILIYTGFAYWIFRGKVREGEGYHH